MTPEDWDEVNDSPEDWEPEPERDELMLACNTPGCLMPSAHYRWECYTVQDAEEMAAEAEREKPTWIDGTPANLTAAASDALRWLDAFRREPRAGIAEYSGEDRMRFGRMVDALREQLGTAVLAENEIHETARQYPEAVAQMVDLAHHATNPQESGNG